MVHRRGKRSLEARRKRNMTYMMSQFGVPSIQLVKRYDASRLAGKQIHQVKTNKTLSVQERDALRNRARMCALCSWGRFPEALVIHHKDRNRTNNLVENLQVLCRNCHYLIHRRLVKEG